MFFISNLSKVCSSIFKIRPKEVMKNLLLFALMFLTSQVFGQTINLDATVNGSTQSTCSATLYDSGGPTGQYQDSEDYSITFCSTNGDCMQVDFTSVDMETNFDYIYVYDGTDITAPLLSTLNGTTIPPSIISSGTCITIRITTDGSVQHDGFAAIISCTGSCYVPPPPPTNNDACSADTLVVDTVCNSITTTTVSATNLGIAAPTCGFNYNGGDVWYQATVPASGSLAIQLAAGSMTDAGIAVYSGPDCNNLTEILCDEQTWQMPALQVVTPGMGLAGQTVWIQIWEPGNDEQGTFDICAFEPPPAVYADPSTYTPQELVEDILVTGCLQAFNVTYTGAPSAIGYYTGGQALGFTNDDGVVLNSGDVVNINGPNTSNGITTDLGMPGDPLLDAVIAPDPSEDAAILEFDFIPSSDTLKFNYIFGSDEYPEFVGSFNDVFAFFLSGTNPSGGNYVNQNIALVPGTTTPVSINNINNGNNYPTTGPCVNCQYYVDNFNGMTFEFDGYTTVLTATALVVPCETYHIKLAVADALDHVLDSGVLLEAGSFSSGGNINASHHSSFGNNPNIVYEGCDNYWIFSRVDTTTINDSLFVNIVVGGTADTANDVSGIPTDFWILPGEIADTFYYDALMDNLTEGQEYLVVSVINGCPCSTTMSNDTVWILDNFDLNPSITPDDHICLGNNFTINTTVNPSLDPALVSYQWSTGDTISSITVSPMVTTTYDVTISQGCFSDTILSCTVTVIPNIGVDFTASQDTICINGTIDFNYTDTAGVSATYLWTFPSGTPATDNTQGPVTVQWNTAGTYNMTLHVDDQGCTGDTSMTVTVLPQPTVTLATTDVLCNGGNDGSITATPNTGLQPFTYLWNDPMAQTTVIADSLTAGTYTVSFIDVFGCSNTASGTIFEPTPLALSVQTIDILCYGGSDGQISTVVTGGIPPYSYNWSNGQISSGISNLFAGNYTVTVTDSNGCIVIGSAILYEPQQAMQLSFSSTDISCNGFSDGSAVATVTGGTAPYSYNWDDGQTTTTAQNLVAGIHCITVTDAHGCQINDCATLTEPTTLTYTTATVPATCNGYNDGSASITVQGGTLSYNYLWSSGNSSSSVNSLFAGNYSVTVTDANGCIISSSVTVTEPDILVVTLPGNYQICDNIQTTIDASGTGGTFPYNFQWNTGDASQSITVSPHQSTTYVVTITDSHNCTNDNSITIDIFPDLYINAFANTDSVCPGDPIVIMANFGGGTGGPYYFYVDSVLSNFPAVEYPQDNHTYLVEIKDDCDYVASDQISVGLYPVPAISFSSDITEGCPPLLVHFNESTSCDLCSYTWNFGDNDPANLSFAHSPVHTYHESGVYDVSLSVVNSNGCSNISTFPQMITVYPAPHAQFSTIPSVISILSSNVQFWNLTTHGENYYWSFGDGDSSLKVSPYHFYADTGDYQVILIAESDLGCLDTAKKTITVQPEMTFWAPTAFSPNGDGVNDVFYVYGYGVDTATFHLTIFDRWGESIFETDNFFKGWNGIVNGNKPANTGVYVWYAFYRTITGVAREQSGIVNLIK